MVWKDYRERISRMQNANNTVSRALISGTVAGLSVALAASLPGKRETGSYAAPLNATSHIAWGDEAAQEDDVSSKYTGVGFVLNLASGIFWAAFYERFFGQPATNPDAARQFVNPIVGAAAVTAIAYVTDYYLVPRRFTPGFEKRLSGKSLAAVYGALALGLAAPGMVRAAMRERSR
jgi:hypothetical protein